MIGLRIGIKPVPGKQGLAIGPGEDASAPSVTTTALSVSLADSADPVLTLENYNYTAIVTNTGTIPAVNVSAAIACPANSTFVSASGTGWTCVNSGHTVTCTRASLAVGAGPAITVTLSAAAADETSSATLTAGSDNTSAATPTTETTGVLLVARDATALKRIPINAAQWTNVGARCGFTVSPYLQWLCQDASGNLADSIGSTVGTEIGSPPTYQATVSGWTQKGISFAEGGVAFFDALTGQPNLATTSITTLFYLKETSVSFISSSMAVVGSSGTVQWSLRQTNTSPVNETAIITDGVSTGQATGTATINDGNVHPYLCVYNKTAGTFVVYTDTEKLTPTFVALSGTAQILLGSGATPAFVGLDVVAWQGANAEFTQVQAKKLLQTLGWTVTGY